MDFLPFLLLVMEGKVAKIVVNGKTYELQPLVFATIKKIWPVVNSLNSIYQEVMEKTGATLFEAQQALDPVYQMEQGLRIVSYALEQSSADFQNPLKPGDADYSIDYALDTLSNLIRVDEVQKLDKVVQDLLSESGFNIDPKVSVPSGDKEPSGEPLTETGTDSLQSLLPLEWKEEAGTPSSTDGP